MYADGGRMYNLCPVIAHEIAKNELPKVRELGFKPYIVAIDGNGGWGFRSASINRFEGIENMIYIPANIAQIEQFLSNFKDMDIMDVYTPLQSLFRSNRYDIVRENVL